MQPPDIQKLRNNNNYHFTLAAKWNQKRIDHPGWMFTPSDGRVYFQNPSSRIGSGKNCSFSGPVLKIDGFFLKNLYSELSRPAEIGKNAIVLKGKKYVTKFRSWTI